MARDTVTVAVEGPTDVPIVEKLLQLVDFDLGPVQGLRGKGWLDQQLAAYNHAAAFTRWLVLRDLNGDERCAGALVARLLPRPSRHMAFRIAVRSVEAWLLADRERMGAFLGVAIPRMPRDPDRLRDPKVDLVNLARSSRRKSIREDMVPPPGLSSKVGPGYTARLVEFARDDWRPEAAAANSASLARSIQRLRIWAR
jgi:hypothetical protein